MSVTAIFLFTPLVFFSVKDQQVTKEWSLSQGTIKQNVGDTKIFNLKNAEGAEGEDYLLEKTKIIRGRPVKRGDPNHTKAASIYLKKRKTNI